MKKPNFSQAIARCKQAIRDRWAIYLLRVVTFAAVIAALAIPGARQVREKLAIVKPIEFIGHSDEAGYALMGKSISEAKGINVPYVSTFFIRYPADITHREDHWPPFMGYSIAPFFYWLGTETWVARIPGILYGSIGLPLATAFLAYALTRRGYVGLFAGLLVMALPEPYLYSMRALSDVPLAMLVTGFCAAVFLAKKHAWLHVAAGILLACAYFAKGSEILLLAMYPVLVLLSAGPAAFRRKSFYAGMLTALLLMTPFWYANWRDYGSPLHTTQRYVSGFFGFEYWDTEYYKPYWGKNLPKMSDRWDKNPDYRVMARTQIAEQAQAALSGAMERRNRASDPRQVWMDLGNWGVKAREMLMGEDALRAERGGRPPPMRVSAQAVRPLSEWQTPVTQLAVLAAVAALAFALLAGPFLFGMRLYDWSVATMAWSRRRAAARAERSLPQAQPATSADPLDQAAQAQPPAPESRLWMVGPILGTWLIVIVHVLFIAYYWKIELRFSLKLLPLLIALGCAAVSFALEGTARGIHLVAKALVAKRKTPPAPNWSVIAQRLLPHLPTLLTLVVAASALCFVDRIYARQSAYIEKGGAAGTFPFYGNNSRHIPMGRWIGRKLPTAVFMCRNPWETLFYAGPLNKGVGLPFPENTGARGAEEIFAIARYYKVTHIYQDLRPPALEPYFDGEKPGLTRVPGAPSPIYELDWKVLPTKTVDDLWPAGK